MIREAEKILREKLERELELKMLEKKKEVVELQIEEVESELYALTWKFDNSKHKIHPSVFEEIEKLKDELEEVYELDETEQYHSELKIVDRYFSTREFKISTEEPTWSTGEVPIEEKKK